MNEAPSPIQKNYNIKKANIYGAILMGALAFIIVFSVFFPRPISIAPGIIGLLAFLTYPKIFGQWPPLPKPAVTICVTMALLAFLSCLWAVDINLSLTRAGKITILLLPSLFLLSVASALPARPALRYLWLIPAAIAVSLVLIVIEIAGDLTLFRFLQNIPPEQNVHLNELNRPAVAAALLFFPSIAIIWHLIDKKTSIKLFMIGGLLALIIAITLWSSSQAAGAGFILGSLAFLLFPYRYKAAWLLAALILVGGIITAPWTAQWGFKHYAAQINEMPFIGMGGGHGAQRLEIYDFIGKKILERPFLGHGIEASRSMTMEAHFFSAPGTTIDFNIFHPHNFALQLWIEFGLIGALAGCVFALYLLQQVYHCRSSIYQRSMFATLVAFFAIISTTYNIWSGWSLGLVLISASIIILLKNSYRTIPDN